MDLDLQLQRYIMSTYNTIGQQHPANLSSPTFPSSKFQLSDGVLSGPISISAARSGSGNQRAGQMGGLTSFSEDQGAGLEAISSASGKESCDFSYSSEERMLAIQRVLMEDEPSQVSEGFHGLLIDFPFPNICELIPSTPTSLPNQTCAHQQSQKQPEKVKPPYMHESLLSKPGRIDYGNTNLELSLSDRLQEHATTYDNRMRMGKGSRHNLGEKERRKEINDLIGTLQAFLPQKTSKMDKATVLSESLEYIKGLQQKLTDLQNRKARILEDASKVKHRPEIHVIKTTADMRLGMPSSSGKCRLQTMSLSRKQYTKTLFHYRVQIDESLTADRGFFQKFNTNNMSVNVSGDTVYFHLKCPRDILLEKIMKLLQTQHLNILRLEICIKDSGDFKDLSIQAKATRADVMLTNDFFVSLIQRSCLSIY